MDNNSIILEFIKEKLLKGSQLPINFDENTPIISSQLLDSFALVTLSNFISVQFKVDMPIRYMVKHNIDTVKEIVEHIDEIKNQ